MSGPELRGHLPVACEHMERVEEFPGSYRLYLVGEPVHAGTMLYMLAGTVWVRVRFEWRHTTTGPVGYVIKPDGRTLDVVAGEGGDRFSWRGDS